MLKFRSPRYRQELTAGMDTSSKVIGTAVATAHGDIVYQAETLLRGEEIKSKMDTRRMYRKSRRGRKTRYRGPRFQNRRASTRPERLPPSTKHKVESHLREKRFIESILPISKWRLELASFDIHALSNPEVSKAAWWTYQRGDMYGYQNLKQYVLHRDTYTCGILGKKTKNNRELHVHHIKFRSNGGPDTKDKLLTLCKPCHEKLHKKKNAQEHSLKLKPKPVHTKHVTEVSVVAAGLRKSFGAFEENFGFITKIDRGEQGLAKRHFTRAAVIASSGKPAKLASCTVLRRNVSKGDYQQTNGARSEKTIRAGKLFGLRKYNLIQTAKGTGFVKGKRSSGYFAISDIHEKAIHNSVKVKSVKVKSDVTRISTRDTVITIMENLGPNEPALAQRGFSIPHPPKGGCFLEKIDEADYISFQAK